MLHHVPHPRAAGPPVRRGAPRGAAGRDVRGTDSTGRGIGFALLHVGDVRNVIDPAEPVRQLQAAGFEHARVDWNADAMRFRAS